MNFLASSRLSLGVQLSPGLIVVFQLSRSLVSSFFSEIRNLLSTVFPCKSSHHKGKYW